MTFQLIAPYVFPSPSIGVIPAETGKLAKLRFLTVSDTKVSGVLPESIRTRIQTGALVVVLNSIIGTFTGRIEDFINSLPATQSAVQVGYEVKQGVSGTLPATTGGLTKLTSLWLWFTTVSGTFDTKLPDGFAITRRRQTDHVNQSDAI
jgi:hypothetical protein